MIDELRELNEQFYALYGRLYKNRELLGKAQEDSIAAKLLAQYEAEYEILRLKEEISRAKEIYELHLRRSALIPRTWRVLWIFKRKYNRAAIQSGAEIAVEVERYFAEREAALQARQMPEYAAEEAEQPTTEDGAEEADETAPESARETPAEGNEGENEETEQKPDETAERGEEAAQEAGEADLLEKTVGAAEETDDGECERFTATSTLDDEDDAPTGDCGATKE